MDMSAPDLAHHVRIILRKDRDWPVVSRPPMRGGQWDPRRRRLAMTRLTRRALKFALNDDVSVRHGRRQDHDALFVRVTHGALSAEETTALRRYIRMFLRALGIRYPWYRGRFHEKRLRIRVSINGGPMLRV